MAPEMLERRGDARSDVYSLGVVLYECLTGDVPFKGDTEWEVLRKHESEAPAYPVGMAEADRRILERCLAKDPAMRFQDASELLRALQAPGALGESLVIPAANGRPTPRPAPRPTRLPPPPPRDVAPARARDPKHSPYTMPWSEARPGRGVLGGAVHLVFRVLEAVIMMVLLPVRVISMGLGNGLILLLQLPFRLVALVLQLMGYVIMAAVVLAILTGLLYLIAMFAGA
jgi:hypothetical protein